MAGSCPAIPAPPSPSGQGCTGSVHPPAWVDTDQQHLVLSLAKTQEITTGTLLKLVRVRLYQGKYGENIFN